MCYPLHFHKKELKKKKDDFKTTDDGFSDAWTSLSKGTRLYRQKLKGSYQQAIAPLTVAYDYNPYNAALNYELGICYFKVHDEVKALEFIENAYSIDANVAEDIHYWLGRANHLNADFEEAIEDIPEMQVKYLNDATSATMELEIQSFINIMARNPNAEFYVYYAGHGYYDSNDDPYMMPVNVKHNEIADAVKLNDFYAMLTQNQTKGVTVFLDACFSGGGRGDDGLVVGRTGLRRPTNNADMDGNLVVFAASSGQQTSKPYNDQKHGIFTYFLLKKLQSTNGNINYSELDEYLLQNVSTTADLLFSEEQTPTVKVSPSVQNTWKNWKF